MTNLNVIEIKISSIREYLKILNGFKKHSCKEIKENLILKGAVERYLYLVVQETIDLAEALVSFKDLQRPSAHSDAFYALNEEGIISSQELTEKLVKMAGFRNVIAHDYKKLDFGIVYDVLRNRLQDIVDFISEVEESLNL